MDAVDLCSLYSVGEKRVGYLASWFSTYGFVHVLEEDDSISRYFTHLADRWSGEPTKGCLVRFVAKSSPKGPRAVRVEFYANGKELNDALAADMLTDALGGSL